MMVSIKMQNQGSEEDEGVKQKIEEIKDIYDKTVKDIRKKLLTNLKVIRDD